jgi:hypothetical protein
LGSVEHSVANEREMIRPQAELYFLLFFHHFTSLFMLDVLKKSRKLKKPVLYYGDAVSCSMSWLQLTS